ncbi:response regulator [candidate division KSB1 bacterium]
MCQGKILCVDDESNVLTVLKRTLEAEGFEVFIASSGKAALTVLEKKNCDIALIDYKMPEMNGIELVKRIKENGCDIESIMVTAYGDVSLIVKAYIAPHPEWTVI